MRIDYGPGYRIYYARHKDTIILLLCGGTKKTQAVDIKQARRLFSDWRKPE
jgi:putative addiction module killer protein